MGMKYQDLYNFGYIMADLTAEELAPVRAEVDGMKDNFDHQHGLNNDLAGNIAKQYKLLTSHDELEQLVLPYAEKIWNGTHPHLWFASYGVSAPKQLKLLDTAWVNFQGPGEFNPVHNHNGLLSFVIWMDIPYHMEDEKKATPDTPEDRNMAGKFQFIYSNMLGNQVTWNMHIDKTYENKMIIFPSKLLHTVYPFFSSKEYRISVAGNFGHESW
jgi:hypothetical protein